MISWPATPNTEGAAVVAYTVSIGTSGGSFQTTTACDGTSSTVVANRECTVPMSTLMAAPFNLALGDTIFAQVVAQNAYGYSTASLPNTSGATIQTVPTLAPSPSKGSTSTDTQIQIVWPTLSGSPADGGSPVTDYKVYWD